jgi:Zn-dependent protease/CBS domain-containing protein
MKENSQKLEIFRIWGIPVCLDYSWFLIFFLYTATIAVVYLPSLSPQFAKSVYWLLGVITSLLVFLSILVHELGHSLAAYQEKIKINNITLHIFGGLAALEHEPKTPIAELRVAAAGPIASFILALWFYLLGELIKPLSAIAYQVTLHLGTFNFLVACFNLLPGFPLDGGRVLRGILWHFDKSYEKATRLTIIFSIFFSISLVVMGIVNLVGNYNLMGGFWTLFAGFLLLRLVYKTPPELLFNTLSNNSKSLTTPKEKVELVKDYINKEFFFVSPNTKITQVLKTYQNLERKLKTIPVIEKQQLHGILFLIETEKLSEKEQDKMFVYQVMKPVTAKDFITLDSSLQQAKTQLNSNGLDYVLVIDNDSLVIGVLRQ